MVPAVLLSGFASPIEKMPDWLQYLTLANPARHFLVIVKGLFLKAMPPLRSTAQSLASDGDRRALAPGGNVALSPWFGVTSASRLITPFTAKSPLNTAEPMIAIICNPRSSA
jgi:hypothetical protein